MYFKQIINVLQIVWLFSNMNALKLLLRKSSKAESLSTIFREEGNNLFRQKKYVEALTSYNKSLCHAKPDSLDLVNGFASRSAVYFELKHYRNSIENIRLARTQSNFEGDINLDEREARCKEFLKLKNATDTEEIFKLSYAAHPQISFLVNGLELCENVKFGRYIKVNRDLRPGDVIAIEEPFLKFTDFKAMNFYKYHRCFNCLKSNQLNLLPGPHSVMSCSQACHDLTMEKDLESEALIQSELDWKIVKMIRLKDYSLAIAGSVEKLEELYYGSTKTIFDFDLNSMHTDELRNSLLKCTISLIGGTNGEANNNINVFKLIIGSYNERHRHFLVQFASHMMNVCRNTQFSINIFDELVGQFEKIGNCLLPFGGLLNHSCDPNIFWISANGKFLYIVSKPIRAGEQLFICYR